MEQETLIFTLKVNAVPVYSIEMHPVANWGFTYLDVPKDVIPPNYEHLQIVVQRKGGE